MSVLTSRNELLTASGLDWLHIVDVSDSSSSPQGTSKKIKLDNLLLNYLGFDSRYYTKTEINNFYSGVTNIAGYNKNDWDDAFGWGDHASAGYLESLQDGQGTIVDNSNPINPKVNWGGFMDEAMELEIDAADDNDIGISWYLYDNPGAEVSLGFHPTNISLSWNAEGSDHDFHLGGNRTILRAYVPDTDLGHYRDDLIEIGGQASGEGVLLESSDHDTDEKSSFKIRPFGMFMETPSVHAGTATNGDVLTLIDNTTGKVEFQSLSSYQLVSEKGAANGYAPLNGSGIIDTSYLPSYVDDVLEYADFASFPASGETGKIYIDLAQNDIYRWSGSVYVEVAGTAPSTWGSITGTLSNQTDLQTALNGKVDVSGDTMTGDLTMNAKILYSQAVNNLSPTTQGDKILFVGSDSVGNPSVADWSSIHFFTTGVFRINGNDIWHSGQTLVDYPSGGTKFSNDGGISFVEFNSQGDVKTTRDGNCIVEMIGDEGVGGLIGTDTNHDFILRRNNVQKFSLGDSTNTSHNQLAVIGDITSTTDITATSQIFIGPEFTNKTVGKLQIKGDGSSQGIVLWDETGAVSKRIWSDAANDRLYITAGATTTLGVYMDSVGDFFFQGDVTADDFIQSSDERLKSNIQPLESKQIKADWKSFEMKGRKRVGVIAQELEQNHPEFVHTNDEGYKAVSYIDLLVAKIHELENRIKQLEG